MEDLLRYHGDAAARGARLDFAVNVRGAAPGWLLSAVRESVGELAAYPDPGLEAEVRAALGEVHGRPADEVLPLSGAAEGFALMPDLLAPGQVAEVVHPQFTEPEAALHAAGARVRRLVLGRPWVLDDVTRPAPAPDPAGDAAGLVVTGNPVNPVGVLHPRAAVLGLAGRLAPGGTLVVDEAFMDVVHPSDHPGGEDPSLAGGPGEVPSSRDGGGTTADGAPGAGVVVLRSLTKTWSLAGLRCGYALGDPGRLERLARRRPHWAMGTPQLRAMLAVAEHGFGAELGELRERIRAEREDMAALLRDAGWEVAPSAAPFLPARPPVADADAARAALAAEGIAVRRCDTFPGMPAGWWRLAVRPSPAVAELVAAVARLPR
ncbi:Rv2231c family pyridoxal phosphate-dependent protein CobC [Corynebacterium sp. 335C]